MTRTVMIVDDDDAIREVAQMSLELVAGWRTVLVPSGLEAVAAATAARPDAILLDVMMPGMDGPATLAALHADAATAQIPVVMLTAKVKADEHHHLAGLPGVRGVLAKPFDPMTLATEVAGLLGWQG